ncbi:MAG: alginate export family protein [Planctomycetes bacterium]|nr:alginate export family protein [Planctomycetota bacterium]MCB9868334.1 alginate export family protein [Planctomycetota bacterium]
MFIRPPRLALVSAFSLTLVSGLLAQDPPQRPWRLREALGTPDWLKVSGSLRLRYEGLTGQYRTASRLDYADHLMVQRTLLRADAKFDTLGLTAEIQDSRHYGGGNGSMIDTTVVNPLDVLQAYGEIDGKLGSGSQRLRLGRETIDVGSRRLVARNRFRNTINAFTGVDWEWESEHSSVRGFWTMPVMRRPTDLPSLVDNELVFDRQSVDVQFGGASYEQEIDGHAVNAYFLVLLEDTGRHRQLYTPGARLLRKSKRGMIDYELEAALQFGESRTSATGADLDHIAWFAHASVGYTYNVAWTPRVQLAFDYASGDQNPTDGDNNRFDTLFGARRFEYGPTGIYGAIARSNILSPEARVSVRPVKELRAILAWRALWLASDQDAWTTSGLRDASGNSDVYVGQQLESSLRWDVIDRSLTVELGGVILFNGDFQRQAPGGQRGDTAYAYLQAAWTF